MTSNSAKKVLTLFGTRPEVIKLGPVIHQLEEIRGFKTINVTSGQHVDLLRPFISLLNIRVDFDLAVMEPNQTLNQVCARVLERLDPVVVREAPDLLLVQGDTTTAMAGALAGFNRLIPVGHVEAGLRSGNIHSPYPEEMNRRIITRLASYHFAATSRNRETLLNEGVPPESIFLTGNPVVDALKAMMGQGSTGLVAKELLSTINGYRQIVLTTHRRESFGEMMTENLRVLRKFIESHEDTALVFPVHHNPAVRETARFILSDHPRIHLIEPLDYRDFVALLSRAWLIVSDSGGVQEEAPTLGKPLLILRENTERPEVVEAGVARLVGGRPERLASMLEEVYLDRAWVEKIREIENPFGQGDSGKRIAESIHEILDGQEEIRCQS
jgi:UDP-N-acetylglucosamine 2-epimerase (non-hydrolysing)